MASKHETYTKLGLFPQPCADGQAKRIRVEGVTACRNEALGHTKASTWQAAC